ncbi:hypothetical protein M408DRAFT_328308 [Serendipita vermifera MAFF 305830]|uniref:Uncharacterized protein n=1 Tax=Serendipita vermifera MAFF 305830 TaxID=933852 RepID=A0A0C3BDQ9_SERVB|nr:hypothetical protein M408DRAFT_328308 [Serendipita vermifera MAFF 305830]
MGRQRTRRIRERLVCVQKTNSYADERQKSRTPQKFPTISENSGIFYDLPGRW